MVKKIGVSVIIMTKNEARNIAKCLRSVGDFEEVFVVDSSSSDNTCELAKSFGAKIINFNWNGKYPKKKQWCLDNLPFSHEYVLYVDADEEVYPELSEEIRSTLEIGPQHNGYFVESDYVFAGRVLKHGHRIYKLVMFNRNKGRFLDYHDHDVTQMWEVEGHYQPKIEGPTKVLRNRMLHDDHNSLFDYFQRHNRYSDWEAVLRMRGSMVNPEESQPGIRKYLKIIFAKIPLKGTVAFIHSYLLKMGFFDGGAGFHFAMARAFYYWQISLKIKELKRKQKSVV